MLAADEPRSSESGRGSGAGRHIEKLIDEDTMETRWRHDGDVEGYVERYIKR